MALVNGWFPPSRENWELLNYAWQFFPAVTVLQWLTDFYPQGKTSIDSRFNIPGKIGWATMEVPGFLTVLYLMFSIPELEGLKRLPQANWVMASLFTIHYIYRAILAPLFLNPSMSPIHPLVWISAFSFQIMNGLVIGGWLGGYGPRTTADWVGRAELIEIGMMIFAAGFVLNIWHDDELREIRRAAARMEERRATEKGEKPKSGRGVDKVYMVPQNWAFKWILYPHYLFEWIEWTGFWVIGGWRCTPARSFVLNEITTMLPRALSGKRWYIKKFGKEEIGNRGAVIPGIL